MSDEYDLMARGKLKLKTDSDKKKKKKKDKKKEREQLERGVKETFEEKRESGKSVPRQMTKAEMAFKQQQAKMVTNLVHFPRLGELRAFRLPFQQEKRIMEKAMLTHKQKVEKFNEHLDSLTEHFDIPKVSWTK